MLINTSTMRLGIYALALSALGFVIFSLTGMTIEMIPIDQSKCPENVGSAADGTCGIYEGRKLTIWTWGCIIIGGIGAILAIYGMVMSRLRKVG